MTPSLNVPATIPSEGIRIGVLSAEDEDPNDSHTFSRKRR